MLCTLCGVEITNPDAGCDRCKDDGAPTDSRPLGDPRLVAAKLAEANLARMRGHWEEAEARCIDVLRLDPSNIEAHSLLGDLYRDQDRLDDAAQWYRLALDINANSAVDQAKLKSVEREIERRSHKTTVPTENRPVTDPIGTRRLLGASPITWLRALTIASVVFVVVIGGVLLVLRARHPAPLRPPTNSGTSASAELPAPSLPPAAVPPAPGGGIDLTDRPDSPRTTPRSAMTAQEQVLAQQVERPGLLSPGTSMIDLTVSPSSLRVDVALMRAEDPTASADTTRVLVLNDAARAARALFAADVRIRRVSVSQRTRSTDGGVQPTFEGVTDRQAMIAVPDGAAPAVEAAAFQNTWWDPELAPQAATKSSHPDDSNM